MDSTSVVKIITVFEFADGSFDMTVSYPNPREDLRKTKVDATVVYNAVREQLHGS